MIEKLKSLLESLLVKVGLKKPIKKNCPNSWFRFTYSCKFAPDDEKTQKIGKNM